MSKLSKTAAASMRGGPVEKKSDPFDTPEKKIQELRNQRRDKLAVVRYDFIDALLEEYDNERAAVAHLAESTSSLLKRAEYAEEGWNKERGAFSRENAECISLLKRIESLEGDINILRLQFEAAQAGNSTDGQ